MRTRVCEIVNRAQQGDHVSRFYDIFIVVVALLSVVPTLFRLQDMPPEAQAVLRFFDIISVYLLAFDYLLRWMTADIHAGRRGDWREFVKFPFTPLAIIDMLAILPTLEILPAGFLFFRALRVFRVFRYSRQLSIIANVFMHERKTLGSVLLLAIAYIFVVAIIMFTFEPQTFNHFLDALYWATITLTTIGFGDIHPTSDLGRFITSITSIAGVFIFALPAGIMTGSFLQQLRLREQDEEKYFKDNFFGDIKWGMLILTPEKIRNYLHWQPKVRLYLVAMAIGLLLNLIIYFIFYLIGQPVWLDTTGTALVACAVDPAAGVIVAFLKTLVLALVRDNPSSLLFFAEGAIVAVVYGVMLHRDSKGKMPGKWTPVKALAIIVVVQTLVSFFLVMRVSHGSFVTNYQEFYRQVLLDLGLGYYNSTILALIINHTLDAIAVYILCGIGNSIINDIDIDPWQWLTKERKKLALEEKPDDVFDSAELIAEAAKAYEEKEAEHEMSFAVPLPDDEESPAIEPEMSDDLAAEIEQCATTLISRAEKEADSATSASYKAGAAALNLLLEGKSSDAKTFEKAFSEAVETPANSSAQTSAEGISESSFEVENEE
ncbi:MAG: ion transporter [Phoenicibacter congonensis]|uniref:Ion transporter n=1 Tax=Phoenicibacter congonensis TaxID=1944646 RepID=A0AA43RH06_9ACTN|nr:ion transporter [Phoenicibacter congonensis]